MSGYSEKQAALLLGISRNTVHVYVGLIYREFCVSSRGELLARCIEMVAKRTGCKQEIPCSASPLRIAPALPREAQSAVSRSGASRGS